MAGEYSVIGKRLPRKDALEKVKGEARYTSDIQLPGMLFVRFLRSPYAHARIMRIDTSKAEKMPGVKAVLTHQNVPKVHPMGFGTSLRFEYLLGETLHYAGEEVAAVAALSKEIADEALKLIGVEYEVLPAVFDKEEAMKPGAPLVYPEMGSNLYSCERCENGMLSLQWGDMDKGFAEADTIIEGTYESPWQHPVSPEPRSVVCHWVGDHLTCWANTQAPETVWRDLARCFGVPLSNVQVISTYSVGGYGGKRPGKTAILTALLAKRTGRPVRAVFTRAEDFIGTHIRHDAKVHARAGVKKDGSITALYTRMISNYCQDSFSGFTGLAYAAVDTCSALYQYQNSRWEGYFAMTNLVEYGPMNGFGDPQPCFCVERLMDEASEKIGMDPVEFRLKNCARYGSRGMTVTSVMSGPLEWGVLGPDIDSFPECIQKAADRAQWKKKWKGWNTPMEVQGVKRRGIGIAIGMHTCLAQPSDSAMVRMNPDGTCDVFSSDPEIGQGLKSAMAQVVAEVFGIEYGDVHVVLADTSITPYGPGVFGSRGTLAGVGTAYRAAEDAKRKLLEIAAGRLGASPQDLEAKGRKIYVKGHKERSISIQEACQMGYQVIGESVLPYPWIDKRTGKKIVPVSVAATICEVEVDIETGELSLLRITSAHDCGKALNPQIVENQIDMSLTMANGWVRSESFIIDPRTGVVLNPNLLDYKLMTMLDMPKMAEMNEIFVEVPCPWGPFGAKGMAETACTAAAPALANAVYNAIGVRIKGDHLTPERILEALGNGSLKDG
jgi:xanthine dehydrogenase molybdenum-binding subunit